MGDKILGNYLIGLREGLEATLVVSILIAYLVKSHRRDKLPLVLAGVGAAVLLSVTFAGIITYVADDLLGDTGQELFEAVTSFVAVAFVTWMIFWMRRAARKLGGELRVKLEGALRLGSFAIAGMAFVAVLREGLETSLLFYAAAGGHTTSRGPLVGICLGVATAIVIGFLLYASAVHINLTRFFTWTGLALILIAAGIFRYGIHGLQEAGVVGGSTSTAFDLSHLYDPTAWYAALFTGALNITPAPTVLELVGWLAYLVPVLVAFLWPARRVLTPPPTAPAAPAAQAAPVAPVAPVAPTRPASAG